MGKRTYWFYLTDVGLFSIQKSISYNSINKQNRKLYSRRDRKKSPRSARPKKIKKPQMAWFFSIWLLTCKFQIVMFKKMIAKFLLYHFARNLKDFAILSSKILSLNSSWLIGCLIKITLPSPQLMIKLSRLTFDFREQFPDYRDWLDAVIATYYWPQYRDSFSDCLSDEHGFIPRLIAAYYWVVATLCSFYCDSISDCRDYFPYYGDSTPNLFWLVISFSRLITELP